MLQMYKSIVPSNELIINIYRLKSQNFESSSNHFLLLIIIEYVVSQRKMIFCNGQAFAVLEDSFMLYPILNYNLTHLIIFDTIRVDFEIDTLLSRDISFHK